MLEQFIKFQITDPIFGIDLTQNMRRQNCSKIKAILKLHYIFISLYFQVKFFRLFFQQFFYKIFAGDLAQTIDKFITEKKSQGSDVSKICLGLIKRIDT